jgi:restriction system protein
MPYLIGLIIIIVIVSKVGWTAIFWTCGGVVLAIVGYVLFSSKKEKQREDEQLKECWEIITSHIQELSIREQQLVINEAYGLRNPKKWEKEKHKFIAEIIKPAVKGAWVLSGKEDAISCAMDDQIKMFREQQPSLAYRGYSNECSPVEYEQYCARLLVESGWVARTTVATGDQGADVIASREGITVVVQCKKYSSPVGNKAIQEAHTAMSYYNADKAIVVSNAAYTTSAKQAAVKTGVLLLHHNDLSNLADLLSA